VLEWDEAPLEAAHDCRGFDSGEAEIDLYLRRHALPNHQRGISKTFVAVLPEQPLAVVGYYTVAPAQVPFSSLPPVLHSKLPRYPIPGFRLARLGVTRAYQGQGLGKDLVFAAGARTLEASTGVGGILMVIDAMTDELVGWYQRHFAAVPLVGSPRTVVVNLDHFTDLIAAPD